MLYFLEEYRNKGYGKQLINYWEKEMLKSNYKIVLTSTLSSEQAQFFYRKNGYIDCGSLLLPNEPLEIILLKNLM
jgi:ribosomal protein S18 acetylase RimI-like enzyme